MQNSTLEFRPKSSQKGIASIDEIISDVQQGRMVVLLDDEDRENEGDLVMAADMVDANAINFMSLYGRGLICLTLTEEKCKQLELPLMVSKNGTQLSTNFTVSIEAAEGVTTGISTADRARTVQAAVARQAVSTDLVRPGHIFPLMAETAGVLKRAGHTEAGCDLAALAGREPAAVICEIMKDDGSMARLPDLLEFARKHDLKVGTIADLITYRHQRERLVQHESVRSISTIFGEFELHRYVEINSGNIHQALVYGDIDNSKASIVRVHSPFNGLDLLDSDKRGHSWSVTEAMQLIRSSGAGVILLMNDDGIGEAAVDESLKLKHYGIGAQILRNLGVKDMILLTRPRKLPAMSGFGLNIVRFLLPNQIDELKVANSQKLS